MSAYGRRNSRAKSTIVTVVLVIFMVVAIVGGGMLRSEKKEEFAALCADNKGTISREWWSKRHNCVDDSGEVIGYRYKSRIRGFDD